MAAHTISAFILLGGDSVLMSHPRVKNPALGGVTPLSLVDTDIGADNVMYVLERIEHSVYS